MASTNSRFLHEQADLEVVPPETGLHPLPTPTPLYPITQEPPPPKEQIADVESGVIQHTPSQPEEDQPAKNAKPSILGLSIPVFWGLIVTLFIVLAAGIGGGVGGGLSAQRKSTSGSGASVSGIPSTGTGGSTTSSAAPSPTPSSTADPLVPADGGCPDINGMKYTPYSADGKPIPIETNQDPQQFREQCWTNWVNNCIYT
ncbi:hypothetical protein CIB48_g2986 [Xylaria polymorpha]|nr:hypothetical protein CIB48_g2986 [Xylaria polymorpha]